MVYACGMESIFSFKGSSPSLAGMVPMAGLTSAFDAAFDPHSQEVSLTYLERRKLRREVIQ